jgi:benzylsuccinate CoA-transferase BbsF subunit
MLATVWGPFWGVTVGVLDDVSVVELSIAIAAPSCGRALAYHGADVVKLESRTNPDVARLFGSAWAAGIDLPVYMDTTPYVPEMGANKKSVGLELKQPEGRRAALALLANSDVFVTNYSTPAMRALGFSYEDVSAVNPAIVYVALPGFGSDASQPYYEFLAWGPNQAPLVGLDALTGYPDQEPAGIATIAPPDYFAGLHAMAAVLTGLEHRDRTGEGSFIDIAQFETTVSSLGPFLLDHALTERTPERSGNRLEWLAPQGCYPCTGGEDRWVAVSVTDDEQWAALARVLGGEATDPRYCGVAERVAHHDELDALIAAWTASRSAAEAAVTLQDAGVPAYEVHDIVGVLHDPQVRDRHWFQLVGSLRFPDGDVFSGHPIHLSETPGHWWRAGPAMGQDTVEMLTKRAGMSTDEVDALLACGVAFTEASPEHTLRRPYIDYAEILGVHRTEA